MSDTYEPETAEYDLSELIDLSVTFKPLQITLNGILKRLAALEKQNGDQAEKMQGLQDELDALRSEQDAHRAESPVKSLHGDEGHNHDELWAAIEGIKALVGNLQDSDEQQRATIDELYAARKRRASEQSARLGSAGVKSSASLPDAVAPPLRAYEEARRVSKVPGSGAAPPSRRPTQGVLEASEDELPVGDLILNLAHEELPLDFDATVAYPNPGDTATATGGGAGDAADQHDGGELPTSERPGSASSHTKQPMPPPPRRPSPPPSAALAGEESSSPVQRVSVTRPRSGDAADPFVPRPFDPAAGRPGSTARPPRASRASRSLSVMGRIREDGEDIAYLNRVVAEMLAEMKSLHNDMDLMRTVQDSAAQQTPSSDPHTAHDADLGDLLRRLEALEGNLDAVASTSQLRDNGLQSDLDELRQKLRPASYITDDDVDAIHRLADMQEKMRDLEDRVAALEKANERLEDKLSSVLAVAGDSSGTGGEINAAQFALLSGTVDALEKQLAELQGRGETDWSEEIARLNSALQRVREEMDTLTGRVGAAEREAARLDEIKADRADLPASRRVSGLPNVSSADLDQLARQLAALAVRMDAAQAKDRELDENKADRESLQRLRDDLSNLKKVMEVQAAATGHDRDGSAGNDTSAATEQLLRELQQQLITQADRNASATADHEDITGLREMIDELEHRKADATLVANKAERDYVENALERLMREVEQVLNATNAGIIDTLDKSLNILRDMIDGRATKQDIARLQQLMAEDGAMGGTPDGLTGFKGYRCLGCNRPMDSLRPRAQAAKLQPFVNRNPQNYPQDNVTRTIQQQQQASAMLEQRGQNSAGAPGYPSIEGPTQ